MSDNKIKLGILISLLFLTMILGCNLTFPHKCKCNEFATTAIITNDTVIFFNEKALETLTPKQEFVICNPEIVSPGFLADILNHQTGVKAIVSGEIKKEWCVDDRNVSGPFIYLTEIKRLK